jgi:hypothetical protein
MGFRSPTHHSFLSACLLSNLNSRRKILLTKALAETSPRRMLSSSIQNASSEKVRLTLILITTLLMQLIVYKFFLIYKAYCYRKLTETKQQLIYRMIFYLYITFNPVFVKECDSTERVGSVYGFLLSNQK